MISHRYGIAPAWHCRRTVSLGGSHAGLKDIHSGGKTGENSRKWSNRVRHADTGSVGQVHFDDDTGRTERAGSGLSRSIGKDGGNTATSTQGASSRLTHELDLPKSKALGGYIRLLQLRFEALESAKGVIVPLKPTSAL